MTEGPLFTCYFLYDRSFQEETIPVLKNLQYINLTQLDPDKLVRVTAHAGLTAATQGSVSFINQGDHMPCGLRVVDTSLIEGVKSLKR